MASIKIAEGYRMFTALSHVDSKSRNRKVGNVAQTWHLTNEKPSQAYTKGNDELICYDCNLRSKASGGNGGCYLVVIHGPDGVWRGTHDKKVSSIPEKIDKPIRFGAYGEPVTMPLGLTKRLASVSKGHLGYTHQWQKVNKGYAKYLMASIDPGMGDTVKLKAKAKAKGYRTFRVLAEGELPMADEVMCPNYTHGVQCDTCGLCAGNTSQAKNITIPAHGTAKAAIG